MIKKGNEITETRTVTAYSMDSNMQMNSCQPLKATIYCDEEGFEYIRIGRGKRRPIVGVINHPYVGTIYVSDGANGRRRHNITKEGHDEQGETQG